MGKSNGAVPKVNEELGEVAIVVGGKAYTLTPTFNAMCELQALTGKEPFEVMLLAGEIPADLKTGTPRCPPDLAMARAIVWAYLQEYHDDEIVTVKDAGRWIERAGGLDKINRALSRLDELNTEPAPASDGGTTANPPGAQAGIGEGSSSTPSESA